MPSSTLLSSSGLTLGGHIVRRLVQVGIIDVFAVSGDFNLALLDHLITEAGLRHIGCPVTWACAS
jgi:pyruvate decarboxylase